MKVLIKLSASYAGKELHAAADRGKARVLRSFFKTGTGQYGQGDIFLGVAVPVIRAIAKKYRQLSLTQLLKLLKSKIHEERLLALIILVEKYRSSLPADKKYFFDFYLRNAKYINNWDLVDLSCHHILGDYLFDKNKKALYKLAGSPNLWERRMAIVSTFHFIKNRSLADTFNICRLLLNDGHDLIHKAAGWMLREAGKRDSRRLERFLKKFSILMPRTMLRYAIEKFPENKRKKYLHKRGHWMIRKLGTGY